MCEGGGAVNWVEESVGGLRARLRSSGLSVTGNLDELRKRYQDMIVSVKLAKGSAQLPSGDGLDSGAQDGACGHRGPSQYAGSADSTAYRAIKTDAKSWSVTAARSKTSQGCEWPALDT